MNKVDIPFYIFLLLLHPIKTFNNILKLIKKKDEESDLIEKGVCICINRYSEHIKEGQIINFTKKISRPSRRVLNEIYGKIYDYPAVRSFETVWWVDINGYKMREYIFYDHFIDISNKDFNTEL